MRTILALLLAFVCASASAQHSAQGTLSGATYIDFNYQPALAEPVASLQQSAPIKLQTRIVWNGLTAGPINVDQHAVLAYTQTSVTSGPTNTAGQPIWTHGAGAILGPFGLGVELWFRNGPQTDAIVWTQQNNRCAASVLGSIPPGTLCLPSSGSSYLTPAPAFALKTGYAYWLRMSITPVGGGWATLYADLIDELSPAVPVQSATVGFQIAQFFPVPGQALSASIARISAATAQPDVSYIAFDYGF